MNKEDIIKYRGVVIERFGNTEKLIDCIIMQKYFKKPISVFMIEVLYDEFFSSALKINILSKIINNNKLISKLKRLSQIRNDFAHSRLELEEYIDKNDIRKGTINRIHNPKKIDDNIDYDELYSEFNKLSDNAEEVMFTYYKEIGGILIKK